MLKKINKKNLTPYILIAPIIIFVILVYGYPLLLTIKYSFQDVSLIGNKNEFIGLKNYIKVLSDEKFYNTLILTFKWVALTLSLKIGVGFIMALFLNGRLYFKKLLRFLILIPWAIPQIVVAILWAWILDGQYGYLNYYLESFGFIDTAIKWLTDPNLAIVSTAVVDAWIGIPLVTMIFISGLSNVSDSLYEAADIDGANVFQKFLYITLPSIKKVLIIALTLTTIWTFNAFNVIYVLTGGGPMDATETIMIKIYHEAFGKYNLGMSSTLAVIVFLILIGLSTAYWIQINKDEE